MDYKEFRAKTVQDAITDALIEFETTSDSIEYEIIEEGSTGLLGLFSKEAVVLVRKKEIKEEEKIEINFSSKGLGNTTLFSSKKKADKSSKATEKAEADNSSKTAEEKPAARSKKNNDKPAERKSKNADKAVEKAAESVKAAPEAAAAPAKAEKPHEIISGSEADIKEVNDLLQVIFEKLDMEAQISTTIDKDERLICINVSGEDTGDIIGKRGQTLDAIQYLVSLVVNKKQDTYYRVKLDTNNYRERRQKTLENLAKNMASKVKKTRKKVTLEPMNPYERRIIHAYLQSDKFVTTKSEGEEPNRRVVIYYKKA